MKYLLPFMILTLLALPVHAGTYIWEDEQGTTNFADDLGSVPKKYRKKARILGAEEPAPAAAEGKQKAAVSQQPETKGEIAEKEKKDGAPAAKAAANAVYGDKEASVWKAQFQEVNADLKANEKQLVAYRNRLKDTAGMSRSEYLSLNNTIKAAEHTVLNLRKKLDDMKQEATKAGVPAELME